MYDYEVKIPTVQVPTGKQQQRRISGEYFSYTAKFKSTIIAKEINFRKWYRENLNCSNTNDCRQMNCWFMLLWKEQSSTANWREYCIVDWCKVEPVCTSVHSVHETKQSSSAIVERTRCSVGPFWPKYKWKTIGRLLCTKRRWEFSHAQKNFVSSREIHLYRKTTTFRFLSLSRNAGLCVYDYVRFRS